MRTIILATAAVASVMMAGTALSADVAQEPQGLVLTGLFESWVGYTFQTDHEGNADRSATDEEFLSFGGSGKVSLPLGTSFSWQSDFYADAEVLDEDALFKQYAASVVSGQHLSWRDPSIGLLGIFGGGGITAYHDEHDARLYFVGAEGQLYLENFTFYLQGGFLDAKDEEDTDALHDAVFVRGVGRFFLSDTSMLQAEGFYANGRQDNDDKPMEAVGWGARFDTALFESPATVFAAYRGYHFDNDPPGDVGSFTEHRIMVGLNYNFSQPTLKSNDRTGATLDLPSFGRIVGGGATID